MADVCGYCGLKALGLPQCSGCKHIHYCSNECQRKDWKGQHRVKCKEIQRQVQKENNTPMTRKQPILKKDNGYRANALTQNIHQRQGGNKETGRRNCRKCVECGKIISTTQKCSRCKKIDYCSNTCLSKNWSEHKLYCTSPEEENYVTITTDGFRREEAFASRVCRRVGFQQAESLSRRTFERSTPMYFIQDIPRCMGWIRRKRASGVFVGFISRMHKRISKSIYLQDETGDEVQVIFALERGVKQSNFRWDDVVPGRYLCIKDPSIDHFSGLMLVSDASTVRVFRV
ncbi:uncharacterized protein LOC117342631 [Pecten maximus]|uniref:uncharacterized protein LOC117342631 n=1 Tax=Pecten maximus TaxID=6579 RepID=UPI001458CE7F|nr:uncharacterized protein LOC117342631 [Pecten maximus]